MARFSRQTILAASDLMANWGHTNIDRFLLEYGLEETVRGNSMANRANALGRHLLTNLDALSEEGENLADSVVGKLVESAVRGSADGYPREFSFDVFRENYPALHRGLERDGFTVEDGQLRRALPEALDLPKADDEVHALLSQYGFAVSRGHLDQVIAAYARGDWAAANAQFRPFIESLFDSITEHLSGGVALPPAGNQRRVWLATRSPPFFRADLNEWDGQGHGFIEGFFKRLHLQARIRAFQMKRIRRSGCTWCC